LRGSSVYRAWNPGPRGTGLTIWRRSAAASFPRFGHRTSRPRKWIYSNGHSLPGRCTEYVAQWGAGAPLRPNLREFGAVQPCRTIRRPMPKIDVYKFGGVAVGSAEAIRVAAGHVKRAAPGVAVVVSAMNGITDLL